METYQIKPGYRSRSKPEFYPDTEANAAVYQQAVYQYARQVVTQHSLQGVIDLGCGYATKLIEQLGPVCEEIVGVDQDHSISHCIQKHGDRGVWVIDDFEKPRHSFGRTFDLVIASDVIEHLVDPDHLFTYIEGLSHPGTWVLLSTPRERSRARRGLHWASPQPSSCPRVELRRARQLR